MRHFAFHSLRFISILAMALGLFFNGHLPLLADDLAPSVFKLDSEGQTPESPKSNTNNPPALLKNSTIPELPNEDDEREISVLLDLSTKDNENFDPQQTEIQLDCPQSKQMSLVLKKIDKDNPRWAIMSIAGASKPKTVAQIAIRNRKILFAWNKTNASEDVRQTLNNSVLRIEGPHQHRIRFRPVIATPDHGFNLGHATPEKASHACTIPDSPPDNAILFEVKDIDPDSDLGRLSQKKRIVPLKKWVVLKFDVNKFLSIMMRWKAQHPKKVKGQESIENMEIIQEVNYELPGGKKNLPLSPQQVNKHRAELVERAAREENFLKEAVERLKNLQRQANRANAAPPGTEEWGKQVHLRNQIATLNSRMKSSQKRYKQTQRDFEILKPMEQVMQALHGRPIPYCLFMQIGDQHVSLVQSQSYHLSSEVCFPLVGNWKNKKGHTMSVTKKLITTIRDGKADTAEIKANDYIGPCSIDPESVAMYERVRSTTLVLYFGNDKVQVRRTFIIRDDAPDDASEFKHARTRDPFGGPNDPFLDWVALDGDTWTRVNQRP